LATIRSSSFDITLRFEMGRYEPTSAASRPGFLMTGVIKT